MPSLLAEGAVEPNKQHVIEAKTLLERAQRAFDIMRGGTVSGERLVWKVWTEEEFAGFWDYMSVYCAGASNHYILATPIVVY